LLDRIDLIVPVEAPTAAELQGPATTTSAHVRDRVLAARERQRRRLGEGRTNARMTTRELRREARLGDEAQDHLARHYARAHLSARGYQRAIRVARTVADLAGRDDIAGGDMLTALGFRPVGLVEEPVAA
jgi:magnesium chelatase family protein